MKFTKLTWQRTYRTFLQAFFGVLASDVALVIGNIDFAERNWWLVLITNLLAPAVASGMAAIMNLEEVDHYE